VTEKILVVDDEQAIVDAVSYALRAAGFEVDEFGDGESALEAARSAPYDVLVVDVRLPGLSGIEITRRLRGESDVPILMLTAMDAEVDRVLGLEAGADDYVTKPFSVAELVSRVRAILRRRELDRTPAQGSVVRVGSLELDLVHHRVRVDGREVELTPSELSLLSLLASAPDRVFARREIMQHLWNSTFVGSERACDIHVSNLRRKIERDPARPERLLTVRSAGYKLVPV
jgi:two-component system, OmpR family, response regulator RegX3